MGFSVASPTNTSSILAELIVNQPQESNEAEGLMLPESLDPETLQELAKQGVLQGEAKAYAFTAEKNTELSQKLTEYLSDLNRTTDQKSLDLKGSEHHLSFKESAIRQKEFKTLEPNKQNLDTQDSSTQKEAFTKTDAKAHETLKQAALPASLAELKQNPTLKYQQAQARSLEQKLQHAPISHKEGQSSNTESNRKTQERKSLHENSRESTQTADRQKLNKYEEREQQSQKQKRDEEEGFAEGRHQQDAQQHPDDEEQKRGKVDKVDAAFAKEFDEYAQQESILSEIFKMRITQFDVLVLFIEILKLEIKSREQEKIARSKERELQILYMQQVVENYKSQANWLMTSSLGAGALAIVSGLCPIIGHMKGDWIIQKLGGIFSGLRGMKQAKFFEGAAKMTFAMSEMYKSTGQVHQTFSEGNRFLSERLSDLHKTDWEENTRTMDDIKDHWKGIENFLYQALQMNHDAIRQLYSSH